MSRGDPQTTTPKGFTPAQLFDDFRDPHRMSILTAVDRPAPPSPAPTLQMRPGEPFPLGATWDGLGTNFSIFSEVAERVELCLFDDQGRETRADLQERTAYCWHGHIRGIGPGQRYGYRVHGPWDPAQ